MRINQCNFAGNIGKDAVTREVGDSNVVSFSIAVQKFKKDDPPLWVRCSFWGERAMKVAPYLNKGTPVYVTGEVDIRPYEGGASLELRVSDLQLLGGGKREATQETRGRAKEDPNDDFPADEDIPF